MRRFLCSLLALALALSAPAVWAQVGHPFIKPTARHTQAAYAAAVQANDQKFLNVDCGQIAGSVAAHTGTQLRTCADLASYIKSLQVKSCPQVGHKVRLGRVVKGVVDSSWSREFSPGEVCLFDSNQALWVFSLSCGNDIMDRLPVANAMEEKPHTEFAPAPASTASAPPATPAAGSPAAYNPCGGFMGFWDCHWKAVTGTVATVGGLVVLGSWANKQGWFNGGGTQTQKTDVGVYVNGNRIGGAVRIPVGW